MATGDADACSAQAERLAATRGGCRGRVRVGAAEARAAAGQHTAQQAGPRRGAAAAGGPACSEALGDGVAVLHPRRRAVACARCRRRRGACAWRAPRAARHSGARRAGQLRCARVGRALPAAAQAGVRASGRGARRRGPWRRSWRGDRRRQRRRGPSHWRGRHTARALPSPMPLAGRGGPRRRQQWRRGVGCAAAQRA